jgi:type II secretory pathway pseudopilin PulG
VTLAVLGLLAAIAFPSLRGLVPRVRLENNAGILANEIALARRQAIAQSVDYSIVFDTAGEAYTLRKRISGGWRSLGTNTVSGSDIVALTGFSDPATIIARADGAMNVPLSVGGSVNFGIITLQTPDASRQSRIRVEPLGRVVRER